MKPRIIKSDHEYQDAIRSATLLIKDDPATGTYEAEQLELLSLLIEDYERKHFTFDIPDPVSAIEFRMEEQGLRQRDLIPILGSRSRVSEVLARKRPLSLQMIRALAESLGIPTDILIRPSHQPSPSVNYGETSDWTKFPFREMQRRGWIPAVGKSTEADIAREVQNFLNNAGNSPTLVPLYRRRLKGLGASDMEERASYSVIAWTTRVLQRSKTCSTKIKKFQISSLSEDFFQRIVKLSVRDDGPVEVVNILKDIGICVVIEPQMPGTLIDGAAILNSNRLPVIGLTLRFDRVDYFWFTLLHELAHVWKHLNDPNESFVDRIDASDVKDQIEKEANRVARESIVPRDIWTKSAVRLNPSTSSITDLANQLGVHPALVAGRVRHETGDYSKFSKLLGQGKVRGLF